MKRLFLLTALLLLCGQAFGADHFNILDQPPTVPVANITGLGTGVGTALGIAVGSAGGPVTNGGAGGTPSSIVLTNATGLPAAQVPVVSGTLSSGSGMTLSAPAGIASCTSTCTVTFPAPALNYQMCVRNSAQATTVITIGNITSVFFNMTVGGAYGTAGHGGTSASGTAGAIACWVGVDSTHYDMVNAGAITWTAN